MNKEELIQFVEDIKKNFRERKILHGLHLPGGNEDQLIEIFKNIKSEDWIFTFHRSYYHILLKGMPKDELMDYVIKYGCNYIFSKKYNVFSSGILGGCLTIDTGIALAIKRKGEKNHVWVFVGDMTAEMGVFNECTKYAARHQLPITFVVEDNGFGIMKTQEVWGELEPIDNVIRYKYTRTNPHTGIGEWVDFGNL